MKRITFIETLVILAIAVPAFAAWTCTPVQILDEQGNVTGTDYACTDTYTTTVNTTESIASLKAKIANRVQAVQDKGVENIRDRDRGLEEINLMKADLANLRAIQSAIKNATGIE